MRSELDARCTLHGRTSHILGHHRPPHVLLVADVAFGSMLSKNASPSLALLLGGDFGLFQAGRCRLIGEHQNRPAKPLTQSTHTLHLLAGRVDAAPSS